MKCKDTKRHKRMTRSHVGNFLGDRNSVRSDRSSVKSAETRLPSSQEWKMIFFRLCAAFVLFPDLSSQAFYLFLGMLPD